MSLGLSAAAVQPAGPERKRYFFDVSVLKLVVMSTVTLTFYQVYWFYRNWRMAKERGEEIIPVLRAIFGVLFAYPLFKDIREVGRSASVTVLSSAGGLAFFYFLTQMTWRFPDPLWLLGYITVLPLAIVQAEIAKVHRALGLDPNINNRFTWKNIAGIVVGGLFLLLMIIGALLPETPA
jgi:hypothetical protein